MNKYIQVTELMSVGPQPSDEDLQELAEQGFKTIVNFRVEGEEDQPLSPPEEGTQVRNLGMHYLHLPVKELQPELVDEFRHALTNLPVPVFAHCKGGTRAGIMALLNTAVEREFTADKTEEAAKRLGLNIQKSEHLAFMRRYAEDHMTTT